MSETAEEARTRRRWITLAEVVAVAGLLIGAGTLYLNWSDRQEDKSEKAAESATQAKAKAIATLTGEVAADGRSIALSDASLTANGATVRFPKALGVGVKDAMPGPRLRAEWIETPLLKLTDKGADEREGRLPVLITVSWWDGAARREDTGLYEMLWRTQGRMLQGRKLALTGLVLRERTGSTAALEAAWERQKPKT